MSCIKIISLFLISWFTTTLPAQNIKNLDRKRGFKNLKIGEKVFKYADYFEWKGTAPNGYQIYQLRPTDTLDIKQYRQIGHIPIQQLFLMAYEGKIYEIRVSLAAESFEEMKTILTQAYGEPNQGEEPCALLETELTKRMNCGWIGESMLLLCSLVVRKGEEEKPETILGFQDYRLVSQMKKELTQEAVDDL